MTSSSHTDIGHFMDNLTYHEVIGLCMYPLHVTLVGLLLLVTYKQMISTETIAFLVVLVKCSSFLSFPIFKTMLMFLIGIVRWKLSRNLIHDPNRIQTKFQKFVRLRCEYFISIMTAFGISVVIDTLQFQIENKLPMFIYQFVDPILYFNAAFTATVCTLVLMAAYVLTKMFLLMMINAICVIFQWHIPECLSIVELLVINHQQLFNNSPVIPISDRLTDTFYLTLLSIVNAYSEKIQVQNIHSASTSMTSEVFVTANGYWKYCGVSLMICCSVIMSLYILISIFYDFWRKVSNLVSGKFRKFSKSYLNQYWYGMRTLWTARDQPIYDQTECGICLGEFTENRTRHPLNASDNPLFPPLPCARSSGCRGGSRTAKEKSDLKMFLSCGHPFHEGCIASYRRSCVGQMRCPYCNTSA